MYKKNFTVSGKGLNNLSFLLFLVFVFSSTGSAQWVKQSPVPTHLDIRGIGAPTLNRVFLGTDDNNFDQSGALFESNDGGQTWVHRNVPASLGSAFNGLFFLDSLHGWAYGNENYRTTDGGTNWSPLPFLGSTYFMQFYNSSFGIASGNFGSMVSNDGGNSWTPSANGMYNFHFVNELTGLGISNTGLYRTTDGGLTFSLVYSGTAEAAVFLSANTAAGIVNDSYVRSTDGGTNWTVISPVSDRNRLFPLSENIVLSWNELSGFPSNNGHISRSTDGGLTWNDLGNLIPEGIYAITSPASPAAVISDIKGNMFISQDGGNLWIQSYTSPAPQPGYLSSAIPVFADNLTGYFAYGNGFVIKTTDGGVSWFQISSGSNQSINDIVRFSNGKLIAGGENGTILTNDGTARWSYGSIETILDIMSIHLTGENSAVAVDQEGQVYQTTDAGISWSMKGIKPPNLNAKDIYFINDNEGWVTGSGFVESALFHTTDGGNNWTPIPDMTGLFVAMDFEGQTAWLLSASGVVYRKSGADTSWTQTELPEFPFNVNDLEFFNADTGYVIASGGYAVRSIDGGNTWQVLPTPESADLFTDIYLVSSKELWITTGDDEVYYSYNGGQTWALLEIASSGFGYFETITASPDGKAWTAGYQGYIEYFEGPPPPPLNQPPIAAFNYNAAGLTVQFMDMSTDIDGSIVSWAWDFGDSTFSNEQNPLHVFPAANTYIVRLTVTDDDGDTGNTLRIIVVQPGPGGTFGNFTEVTPLDSVFVTNPDEDFWVITTAPADFDGDSDLDIAVLGYYVVYNQSVEDRLLLLRNDGPADSTKWAFTYISVPLGEIYSGASDLAWGDIDRDGDLDLVVASNQITVVYRNDNGNLVVTDTELPGYWEDNDQADFDLRSVTFADFDNDGDPDLLLPSVFDDTSFTYRTALMRNDGLNGTGGFIFTEINSGLAPTSHAQSSWADFDGDQDLDLLLVNIDPIMETGFIRIYKNDGNGSFTGENVPANLTVEHGEAQWGDYDTDGDLDILIAGLIKDTTGNYTQALRIYRNDSTAYTSIKVIDCIPCEGWLDLSAATWADYDSDGDMDILLAGSYNSGSQIEGRARIYINTNGTFTISDNNLPAPRASGTRGGTFSWLDIDGEGDLDYFIAGQYFVPGGNGLVEAQMHIYRNDASVQNNAPTSPGELNSQLQNNNTVLLRWTASTDDHTPAAAITYDIELFKDNLPVNIADRLPEPGNVSAVNEWLLTGLADGNYTWRIKAVDAAYIGSTAATGTFTIGISSAEEENIPAVYSLSNNYPNPFNPYTTIKYSVASEGLVTLKIYNITGEEVAVLINEYKKPGSYEVKFDASDFSSQIFFYRIQAGDFVQTRKMILMK